MTTKRTKTSILFYNDNQQPILIAARHPNEAKIHSILPPNHRNDRNHVSYNDPTEKMTEPKPPGSNDDQRPPIFCSARHLTNICHRRQPKKNGVLVQGTSYSNLSPAHSKVRRRLGLNSIEVGTARPPRNQSEFYQRSSATLPKQ